MQIQVNTGGGFEADERFVAHVETVVHKALDRFGDQITRVEVHAGYEDGDGRGQQGNRCVMEARLAGQQPAAVTHDAASIGEAVDGAADKLARHIESVLGRLRDHR